jgi:hypothetical protein
MKVAFALVLGPFFLFSATGCSSDCAPKADWLRAPPNLGRSISWSQLGEGDVDVPDLHRAPELVERLRNTNVVGLSDQEVRTYASTFRSSGELRCFLVRGMWACARYSGLTVKVSENGDLVWIVCTTIDRFYGGGMRAQPILVFLRRPPKEVFVSVDAAL